MDIKRKLLFHLETELMKPIKAIRIRYMLLNVFREAIQDKEIVFSKPYKELSDTITSKTEYFLITSIKVAFQDGSLEEIKSGDPRFSAAIVPMGASWRQLQHVPIHGEMADASGRESLQKGTEPELEGKGKALLAVSAAAIAVLFLLILSL